MRVHRTGTKAFNRLEAPDGTHAVACRQRSRRCAPPVVGHAHAPHRAVFELDTATDTVSDKPLVYPMCCIAFGIAADVLLDIEAARFLGPARTVICAVKRLLYDGAVPYRWKVRYRSPLHAGATKCEVPERRRCDDCDCGTRKYHPKEALQDHPFNTMSQMVLGVHRAKSMAAMPDGCFFPLAHFSDGLMDGMCVAYGNGERPLMSRRLLSRPQLRPAAPVSMYPHHRYALFRAKMMFTTILA